MPKASIRLHYCQNLVLCVEGWLTAYQTQKDSTKSVVRDYSLTMSSAASVPRGLIPRMNGMDTELHVTRAMPLSYDPLKTYIKWLHLKHMAIERFQSDDSLVGFPFLILFSFHSANDQLTTKPVDGVDLQINVKMTTMCCHQNAGHGYYVMTVKLFDKCNRINMFWEYGSPVKIIFKS
jgi:hypothetical protein